MSTIYETLPEAQARAEAAERHLEEWCADGGKLRLRVEQLEALLRESLERPYSTGLERKIRAALKGKDQD